MDEELERRLRVLVDKQDIHDVLMRYCRGVDRCDPDLIASVYHPDAIDDHGTFKAAGRDCADLIVSRVREHAKMSMHFIGNELVDVDGDVAFSESYFISYVIVEREGADCIRALGARYVDRFERRDGEWKIAHRVVVSDWSQIDPLVLGSAPGDALHTGQRSSSDAVYQIRALLRR